MSLQPIHAVVMDYQGQVVSLSVLDESYVSNPFDVATSLVHLSRIGPEFYHGMADPIRISQLSHDQRIDTIELDSVIAWIPDWKLSELKIKPMTPQEIDHVDSPS